MFRLILIFALLGAMIAAIIFSIQVFSLKEELTREKTYKDKWIESYQKLQKKADVLELENSICSQGKG